MIVPAPTLEHDSLDSLLAQAQLAIETAMMSLDAARERCRHDALRTRRLDGTHNLLEVCKERLNAEMH